jgi:hypothetical protein
MKKDGDISCNDENFTFENKDMTIKQNQSAFFGEEVGSIIVSKLLLMKTEGVTR